MKKKCEFKTTEYKTINKVIKKELEFPLFWKDEYGFIEASIDGENTIVIGVNGVINNKIGTHSIETRSYLSSDIINKKTRMLSKKEFIDALDDVILYAQTIKAYLK